METYLVGGAVRDELLGLEVKERDWVITGVTSAYFRGRKFIQVGKKFPVFLHPETKEEYALARKEYKVGEGYHGFRFDTDIKVTIEQDLQRRDLTINSIARAKDGTLIDPYKGLNDLQNKIIRHTSSAFIEDPLRVLRVARFAAYLYHLGFSIDPATMQLLKRIVVSEELQTISPERIWLETKKALVTQSPLVYFEVLDQCGALEQLMPQFAAPKWRPFRAKLLADDQGTLSDVANLIASAFLGDASAAQKFCKHFALSNKITENVFLAVTHFSAVQQICRVQRSGVLPAQPFLQFLQQIDYRRRFERARVLIKTIQTLLWVHSDTTVAIEQALQVVYEMSEQIDLRALSRQYRSREIQKQFQIQVLRTMLDSAFFFDS